MMRFLLLVTCAALVCSISNGQQTANGRPFPLDRVSSGALMLLDHRGDLVRPPSGAVVRKNTADLSLTAGLDPRVGPNVLLGADPAALPANLRGQAEPHIARSPTDPDLLVATFQEGRYTDGGAVDCGYGISRDGGLTWTRALAPAVTTVTQGPYYRATDPVAAIYLRGNIYLNMLGALDPSFGSSALIFCRSTNGGASFEPPVEITRSPSANILVDKNWMAVNTFPGAPYSGRIVSTFTRFDDNGYPQAISHSDDQGQTWSPWQYITPGQFYSQGSQPVWLPSGQLAVAYWNFDVNQTGSEQIEVRVSDDGGASFIFSNRVAVVTRYDAPHVRDGLFLPSATANRTNNSLYVTWQATYLSRPRVMFCMSTNAGVNWTTPVSISDNPANSSVFNPAIGVSPDGQQIAVVFYDTRVNVANGYLVDLFLAQSIDGGRTWLPNIRLSTVSSDVRLAPLTDSGYMLGDYLGVAPSSGTNIPAVPVFVGTATGNPDPFVVRVAIAASVTFESWRAARFSAGQIGTASVAGPLADPDQDGFPNLVEYAFGMDPSRADTPDLRFTLVSSTGAPAPTVTYQSLAAATDLSVQWEASTNLLSWVPAAATLQTGPGMNNQFISNRVVFGSASLPQQFFRLKIIR